MCLIAIAWKTDPRWPLVLIGNRDEAHARPTDAATFWHDEPDILAGRDRTAGGTWLGVRSNGRFAVVTNYREQADAPPNARSRGHLIGDFLRGSETPDQFMASVANAAEHYAGFNLFVGDTEQLMYFCNREGGPRRLEPGRYALSNATLDTPWPKVERMREAFARYLDTCRDPEADNLLALLHNTDTASNDELPDTGLPHDTERLLSAPFIVSPHYGTRASTVLSFDMAGHVTFVERSFNADGAATETRAFVFPLTQ